MPKFRTKPVVIDAMKYDGNNGNAIYIWSNGMVIESPVCEPTVENPTGAYLQIKNLGGTITAIVGDMIIRRVDSGYYPCKPDIFEKTYEPTELDIVELCSFLTDMNTILDCKNKA